MSARASGDLSAVLEVLRGHGLCGERATHGAPDELLLLSAGPEDDRSRWSLMAGPPRRRLRLLAPTNVAPTLDGDAILSGELPLETGRQPLHSLHEVWREGVWAEEQRTTHTSLCHALAVATTAPAAPATQVRLLAGPEDAPPPPLTLAAWSGALAWDLAAWSTPLSLPRHASDPLAVLWRPERWLVHDHLTGASHLLAAAGDPWLDEVTRVVEVAPPQPTEPPPSMSTTHHVEISPGAAEHAAAVARLQEGVRAGAVYQANLARRWRGALPDHPWSVLRRLTRTVPSPRSGWASAPDLDWALASASPERLLDLEEGWLTTSPIKGTGPRHHDPEADEAAAVALLASPKERAEHRMLVDLLRHDLGAVCEPGTVRVDASWLEHHPAVHHLTSDIVGRLRAHEDGWSALAALWPGGSISGCPKVPAVAAIAALEAGPRGMWCGSLGLHDPTTGWARWNLLIRSMSAHHTPDGWTAEIWAGGGIVIDSDAATEVAEVGWKADALLGAAGWATPADPPATTPGRRSIPPERALPPRSRDIGRVLHWPDRGAAPRTGRPRVLFLDLLDSFSWNILHALAVLGADVALLKARTSDHDQLSAALSDPWTTHLVIGPGPGAPRHLPHLQRLSHELLDAHWPELPTLGVCLGQQLLTAADGWTVDHTPSGPVHGRPWGIQHAGTGLFTDLPTPLTLARYHSLACIPPSGPHALRAIAWTDGEEAIVQAIMHPTLPIHAVQSHPESVASPDGAALLTAFLALPPRRATAPAMA